LALSFDKRGRPWSSSLEKDLVSDACFLPRLLRLIPSFQEAGVLRALAGVIGLIQATESLKLILGIGEPLIGKLVLFDALEMDLTKMNVRRDIDCPICRESPTIRELIDYDQFCGSVTTVIPPP
jgi:molybdopterin/thiamine biosynthesis adenylyltransferase